MENMIKSIIGKYKRNEANEILDKHHRLGHIPLDLYTLRFELHQKLYSILKSVMK